MLMTVVLQAAAGVGISKLGAAFGAAGAGAGAALGAAGAASLRGGKFNSWIAPVGQTATHFRHIRHFV